MAAKKKKKDPSWDQLGKIFERKMKKEFKDKDCGPSCMHSHQKSGGGLGRFVFIIGVLWAMNSMGYFIGLELWQLAIIVIGFTMMKF